MIPRRKMHLFTMQTILCSEDMRFAEFADCALQGGRETSIREGSLRWFLCGFC